MRTHTRPPRDLEERLAAVDPARDVSEPNIASAEAIIARGGDVADLPADPVQGSRSRRTWRWAAPLAAAATVAAVVVGVVTVGRSGSRHTLAGPSPSAAASSTSTNPSVTDKAARMWAGFPVDATPRPLVLVGMQVDGPDGGFRNSDDKLAFLEGKVAWPASVQESIPTGSIPTAVLTARQAFALLPRASGKPPTPVTLQVTAVTLTTHAFATDRGAQQLPAWEFRLDHVTNPVYVLAVAAVGRYPAQLADGSGIQQPAVVSADGRSVTVLFTAHQDPGPCQSGFDQTLDVAQTPTAVVLAVTVTRTVAPTPPTMCAEPGLARAGPLTPGATGTRTITLEQPLGNRVVVDGSGQPYQVDVSAVTAPGTPSPAASNRTTTANLYSGPITHTVTYYDNGLRLDPPGNAVPRLTPQQALAAACAHGGMCNLPGTPQHLLALVTTPNSGQAGPNGTIIPEVSHVLSYVFTWTNVPCTSSGGGAVSGAPYTNPPVYKCVVMQPVDANTGAWSAGEFESVTP